MNVISLYCVKISTKFFVYTIVLRAKNGKHGLGHFVLFSDFFHDNVWPGCYCLITLPHSERASDILWKICVWNRYMCFMGFYKAACDAKCTGMLCSDISKGCQRTENQKNNKIVQKSASVWLRAISYIGFVHPSLPLQHFDRLSGDSFFKAHPSDV